MLYRLSITVLNSRVRGRGNLAPSLPQRIVNQIAPWSVIDEHDLLFISVLFYFHKRLPLLSSACSSSCNDASPSSLCMPPVQRRGARNNSESPPISHTKHHL